MADALSQVEDAANLLRDAGPGALVWHWLGSMPFAFGVLVFWDRLLNARLPAAACAQGAFLLTILLIWMSCCRALFSVRLRSVLMGRSTPELTRSIFGRILRTQCTFAGFKLAVLPVVALGWVTAFFRNTTALADLELSECASRSRKLAGLEQTNNFMGLGILAGLTLFVFLNILIAMAGLPYLLRSLTGYESPYTRAGLEAVFNPLFLLGATLITWILMDPVVQAFYCVRCFHAASLETGEDLRARLRSLQQITPQITPMLMMMLLLLGTAPARGQVGPPELRESVEKTLQSPLYDWRHELTAEPEESWAAGLVKAVYGPLERAFTALRNWLRRLLQLLDRRDNHEPVPSGPPATVEDFVYLLTALAAAGALAMFWFARRSPAPVTKLSSAGPVAVDLHDDTLTADRLPEDQWIALAGDRLRGGDCRGALRALFLGNLAMLNARSLVTIHPGKTDRQYETELRRKCRDRPEATGIFSTNIGAYQRSWYGSHPAATEDVTEFRARSTRLSEVAAP